MRIAAKPVALLLIATVLGLVPAGAQQPERGRFEEHMLYSEAIDGNLFGLSPDRSVIVYLPPGYDGEEVEYPSVYFLHGIFGSNAYLTGGDDPDINVAPVLDDLMTRGVIPKAVYVFPHAGIEIGGGMYTNSSVFGGWEDFIVEETVGLVDEHYRTLLSPTSRGIVGHSMGGHGALKIALRHSDVFGAAFVMSPAVLDFGEDLTSANPAWRQTLEFAAGDDVKRFKGFYPLAFLCIAASFSPAPDRPLPVEWPYELTEGGELVLVEPVVERWESEMPLPMARRDPSHLRNLTALRISVGQQDFSPNILQGCRRLTRLLQEQDVPHEYAEYDGDHLNRIWERFQSEVIPFFAQHLEGDEVAAPAR